MNILWSSFLASKVPVQATHALNGNAYNLKLEVLNFGVGWVTDTHFMAFSTPSRQLRKFS